MTSCLLGVFGVDGLFNRDVELPFNRNCSRIAALRLVLELLLVTGRLRLFDEENKDELKMLFGRCNGLESSSYISTDCGDWATDS